MVGNKVYSFTDNFSTYHQVQSAKEDQPKITFTYKWGLFMYNVMPFGLKNALVIFS